MAEKLGRGPAPVLPVAPSFLEAAVKELLRWLGGVGAGAAYALSDYLNNAAAGAGGGMDLETLLKAAILAAIVRGVQFLTGKLGPRPS